MLRHGDKLSTLVVLMLLVPAQAQEQRRKGTEAEKSRGVLTQNGFCKGDDFRKRSEGERRAYAAGVVDGMLLAPLLVASAAELRGVADFVPSAPSQWLASCVVGMTDEQVAAIVAKYLNDHPERWHQGAKESVLSALFESCPKPSGDHR